MAEEKKFLDETMEQPKNRKLVAKNVVLAFVVFVILLLCVLAWFSSRNEATASGLSVKTSGSSGLEVSLDGGRHWSTKWSSDGVEDEEGWQVSEELKKFASGGSLMQLLSGDGRDLYYPKNVDANGEAKNFEKISDDKAGDYCLEFEAYFRSESKSAVSLTSESFVLPYNKDDETRIDSTYGFSPDYIAGAARVAFLKKTGDDKAPVLTKTGLWIPNPFYHLGSTSGTNYKYKKMPDNYGGSVVTTPGGGPTDTTGKSDYYFWTSSVALKRDNSNHSEVLSNMIKIPMQKIDDGKYYCQFYTVQPMPGRVEQVFSINQKETEWDTQYDIISSGYAFTQDVVNPDNSRKIDWNLYSGTYNLTNSDGKTYVFHHLDYKDKDLQSTDETSELVRVVLDTKNKVVSLFEPDNSQVSISKPEGTGKLQEGEEIVVTKGATTGMSNTLAGTRFDPAGTNSECDLVVAAVHSTDNKYKFKFKNAEKYLAVDSNGALTTVSNIDNAGYFHIIFSETKTQDEENNEICEKLLAYISTDSDGNQSIEYVTLSDSAFVLSSSYGTGYMIYQKIQTDYTNFSFDENGTPETEDESWGKTYYYFDDKTKTKAALDSKEYSTTPQACTKLVTLEKTEEMGGNTYYTGKLIVRIFAEGYDREAQKPMEKGKIKVNLQFSASNIS